VSWSNAFKPRYLVGIPLVLLLLVAVACGAGDPTPQPTATPVDIEAALQRAVAAGVTSEDVAMAVKDALATVQTGATSAEVASAIAKALAEKPGLTTQDVASEIAKALAAQPGVTTQDVASAIASALAAQPGVTTQDMANAIQSALAAQPGVTQADVTQAITEALKAQPGITQKEVEDAIKTALAAVPTVTPQPGPEVVAGRVVKYGGVIPMHSVAAPGFGIIHMQVGGSQGHISAVYSHLLVQFNPETEQLDDVRADVAKGWTVSPDGITYTFKLHENIKFHDGTPLTAADVAFSIQLQLDPNSLDDAQFAAVKEAVGGRGSFSGRPLGLYFDSSRVIDDQTLEIKLKFPTASLLVTLAPDGLYTLPKQLLTQGKIPSFREPENLIGSGPFKLVRHEKDLFTEVERNPDYFKKGRPFFDGIVHHVIVDKGSVIAAYKTGQVLMGNDLQNNLSARDGIQISKELGTRATVHWSGPVGTNLGVFMNGLVKPFDDPRVRRAMHLVLHRQPIVETVGAGKYAIGTPFPIGFWWSYTLEEVLQWPGYRELNGEKHPDDIKEAQRLMLEAGAGPGTKLTLKCRTFRDQCDPTPLIKEQLKKWLGWDITIKQMESQAYVADIRAVDYVFITGGARIPDFDADGPGTIYRKGSAVVNFYGNTFFHPDNEPIWDAVALETDQAKRAALMRQANDNLLQDNVWPFLYYTVSSWIVDNRIQNFHIPSTTGKSMKHEHLWCDPKC